MKNKQKLKGATIRDCTIPPASGVTRAGVIQKVLRAAGRVEVAWSSGKTTEVAISKIHDDQDRTTGYFLVPEGARTDANADADAEAAELRKNLPPPETNGKEGFMGGYKPGEYPETPKPEESTPTLDGQDPSDA